MLVIPVEQREMAVFDEHGDNVHRGDCMRASLASIFELPLEEVPHFAAMDDWWGEWMRWLEQRGLRIATAFYSVDENDPTLLRGWPGDIYWLATVRSPRGRTRCAMCKGAGATREEWVGEREEYVKHETPQPCRECGSTGLVASSHMVVMLGRELVWDPHPQRDMGHLGFTGGYEFRVIDPARVRIRDESAK